MSATPDDPRAHKAALRAEIKARLALLPARDVAMASVVCCGRVVASPLFERAGAILLYMPLARELDVSTIAVEALRAGKAVYLPRIDWDARAMLPARVRAWGADVVRTRHNLLEPGPACPPGLVSDLDLVVVPGLAFDARGGRLGRGAGFYDRFLSHPALRAVTMGVALEAQVLDRVPVEPHDAPLHALATEARLLQFAPRA